MRRNEYEITDNKLIREILGKAEICHVAFHDDPYPYLLSLNFGLEYGPPVVLYFHCAPEGKKLDLIRRNNKVCFGIETDTKLVAGDLACDWSMQYRSIVGYGTLEIVEDRDSILHGLDVLMHHYSGQEGFEYDESLLSRTCVLKLRVETLSGKQHGNF